MIRRSCMLLLVVLPVLPVAAADVPPGRVGSAHIRCLAPAAEGLLREAMSRSQTVARLVARVERSDVIVFLALKQTDPGDRILGKTEIVTAAPGARYLLVTLDPRGSRADLVGRLAHELQHVAEIADAPEARDTASLRALLKRIGWRHGLGERWETGAAIETGRRATWEAEERRGEIADLARRTGEPVHQ